MLTDTNCEGDGTTECTFEIVIEYPIECPTCNGTGTIHPPPMVGLDVTGGIDCPKCMGSGKI